METSKKIILISYIIGITLTTLVVIGTFLQLDVSYLTQLALASYGEITASNVFYYNKSKAENIIKISKALQKTEEIDINQLMNV